MAARLLPVDGGPGYPLDKVIVLIGRQDDCDVVLSESRKVSRHHCCISHIDSGFVLRDLGSMNGVRVNGTRVREIRLNDGDQISIGDLEFRFTTRTAAGDKKSRPPAPAERPSAPAHPGDTDGSENPLPPRPPEAHSVRRPRPLSVPLELSMEFPVPIPEDETPPENPARRDDSEIQLRSD
jgi:pSer/pThr/pTyr-binding forkhead associated (FHA) protein